MARIKMANKTLTKKLEKYIVRPELKTFALTTPMANLEKDLEAIEKVNLGIESEAQTDLYNQKLNQVYCSIDPSFLKMRHPNIYKDTYDDHYKGEILFRLSLPRFAVYSLNSPICSLEVSLSYQDKESSSDDIVFGEIKIVESKVNSPDLPSFLEENILKSLHLAGDIAYKGGNSAHSTDFEFKSMFKGIIPEAIKKIIRSARKSFGKEIYVIAEADNWKSKRIYVKDPLLVGVKGQNLYLIDSFDTTLMEEYVRREFSQGD